MVTHNSGAGVSVVNGSTFNMYGGTISKNRASDPNTIYGEGGGVYVDGSTFKMTGGEIKGNSASEAGRRRVCKEQYIHHDQRRDQR